MKSIFFLLGHALIALILTLPLNAYANYNCIGIVSNLFVDHADNVYIESTWRADWTEVCSLSGNWNNIDQVTCGAWYSLLVLADRDEKQVIVQYPSNGYGCSNLPTYGNAPEPYYVGLRP